MINWESFDKKIEELNDMIVRYKHHGKLVSVRGSLKGRHREHCLCYTCARFDKGCEIAQATYENCVKFGIVTPVWECPDFRETSGD